LESTAVHVTLMLVRLTTGTAGDPGGEAKVAEENPNTKFGTEPQFIAPTRQKYVVLGNRPNTVRVESAPLGVADENVAPPGLAVPKFVEEASRLYPSAVEP
jgi:hypothetical protein